jgi:hypothetical protein
VAAICRCCNPNKIRIPQRFSRRVTVLFQIFSSAVGAAASRCESRRARKDEIPVRALCGPEETDVEAARVGLPLGFCYDFDECDVI